MISITCNFAILTFFTIVIYVKHQLRNYNSKIYIFIIQVLYLVTFGLIPFLSSVHSLSDEHIQSPLGLFDVE